MKKLLFLIAPIILLAACTTPTTQNTSNPTPDISNIIQNTTQPTVPENWKSYTNTAFGLTFLYPTDYSDPKVTNNELISFMSPIDPNKVKNQNVNEKELKVEFYIQPAKENDSLEKFLADRKDADSTAGTQTLQESEVTINGKKAVHKKISGMMTTDTYYLVTPAYRVMIIKYPSETTRQAEFDTFLQTIQFTK